MSDDDLFEKRDSSSREVFTRYNREDRIKNASEKVRQLHDPDFVRKRSFIKSVTENRGLRSVFFVIVVLVSINIAFFITRSDRNSGRIYGIKVELKSFIYQDRALANLRFSENTKFLESLKESEEKVFIREPSLGFLLKMNPEMQKKFKPKFILKKNFWFYRQK